MVAATNPGEILLGKYRVEEVIGIGGMGRVVRASHLYLQQPVAIKILLPNMVESRSTVERFLREAQSTVRLRSEHIARVMDVGTLPDGAPFMVMEFLEGFDLNQILRHHGPQMAQPVVDLMLQACEGISEAHALGIIHRDIKPSNFFITRRPDGSNLLKILDFGISKTPEGLSELTGTQTVIGTPTYMAPEQMRTARSTDPRSDIWSMGVVMYQMLAGRPPFEAETYAELVLKVGTDPPAQLHVAMPPGLESILMRCLEKDPRNRIQNVGDLARQLAPYASDPISAAQSADRATRILTSPRAGGMSLSSVSVGSGGMGLQTPPALTPKSWNQTGGSSLGGAAGQMGTKVVHGGRGLVIGIVATLCVGAGIGGFTIANSMSRRDDSTHVAAPPKDEVMTPNSPKADVPKVDTAKTDTPKVDTAKTEAPKTDAPKTEAPKTDAPKTDAPKTDAAKAEAPKTDAPKTPKTDAPKTDTAKTTTKIDTAKTTTKTDTAKTDASVDTVVKTAKTDAKTTAKTAKTKTAKTTKTTKVDKGDSLFDDRH